jgi:hypothetical protein
MIAVVIAVFLGPLAMLTVWAYESRRRNRRRDEIRQTVWSAVTSLHLERRAVTLLSVLGFLRVAGVEIEATDVLSALETRVREGYLERLTMDACRWRHRQTVLYRLISPQMFSATADAEEQITYEAVMLLGGRGLEAFVSAVNDLTQLGSKRTFNLLTELTRKGWLEEYKVPSASSDDVLFAYRRVRSADTADG